METELPDNDKFHEECGVVAVYGHKEAANLAYLGLYALQHRGQESAGITSCDRGQMYREVGMGLVADIFNTKRIKRLPGNMALAHNRYSTAGESKIMNAQPCLINYAKGSLALAHNGNLVNANTIREALVEEGAIFQSTNDSEVIVHLIAHSHSETFVERVVEALLAVNGAYSLALMTDTEVVAARDPYGFRPLCLGKLDGGYIVASESCVMDLVEAEFIREIEPGEVLLINKDGLKSFFPFRKMEVKRCIFEHIYFSDILYPGSLVKYALLFEDQFLRFVRDRICCNPYLGFQLSQLYLSSLIFRFELHYYRLYLFADHVVCNREEVTQSRMSPVVTIFPGISRI